MMSATGKVMARLTGKPERPEEIAQGLDIPLKKVVQTLNYQVWKKEVKRSNGLYWLGKKEGSLSNDWLKKPLIQERVYD
jgi:hypothetical protein